MGVVADNAFINPSTYMGGLDDMGSSGLSTGGGFVPQPTDATTASNLQKFGGLTTTPKTSLLDDIGTTAYEGISSMNPMEQVQLAQMGLDAATPEERAAVETQMAQIRPPKEVTVGTPLAINTPTRTFKPRFA